MIAAEVIFRYADGAVTLTGWGWLFLVVLAVVASK